MSRHHRNISAGRFSHRISRFLTATAVAILATSLPHTAFAQEQPEFTDLACPLRSRSDKEHGWRKVSSRLSSPVGLIPPLR